MSTTTEYIDAAQVAKMVRKHLKSAFPTTRFSVTTDRYAGGSSIDVSWMDGPPTRRVEEEVNLYHGAEFDGMTDLKSYASTVLVNAQGPREVHLGNDFIFCKRRLSNEQDLTTRAAALIRTHCVVDGTAPNDMFGGTWVTNLARAVALSLDFTKHDDLDAAFRRVVLRDADA